MLVEDEPERSGIVVGLCGATDETKEEPIRLVKRGNSRKSMSEEHRAKLTANWRRTKTK
jgi:hypothetical protein